MQDAGGQLLTKFNGGMSNPLKLKLLFVYRSGFFAIMDIPNLQLRLHFYIQHAGGHFLAELRAIISSRFELTAEFQISRWRLPLSFLNF